MENKVENNAENNLENKMPEGAVSNEKLEEILSGIIADYGKKGSSERIRRFYL